MPIIPATIRAIRQGQPRARSQKTTITTAQVLALNATPIEVVSAPAAGLANVIEGISIFYDFNTAAYAGIAAGEDLALAYTGGGAQVTIETTGFLDQGTDQHRYKSAETVVGVGAEVTPVANSAMTLGLLVGEIITGDSPLEVEVFFKTIEVGLP